MDLLGTAMAIVSVYTPGTGFLTSPEAAAAPARQLNAFSASLAADHPGRFGYFAALPMPDAAASAAEARRALDELGADAWTTCGASPSPPRCPPARPPSHAARLRPTRPRPLLQRPALRPDRGRAVLRE
ncbi:amidohydrolase family protein [Streptomyces sp. NPDC049541]|uniref:amidohydrolase family protein n=1 Tax=Streptomyces sp. NPDC049541 TaxID=3365594 RepID=UPI0037907D8A